MQNNPIAGLEHFRVKISLPVAWGEMDAFGHVNNTVFFRYFESARVLYFDEVGFDGGGSGIGPILRSTQARFYKPLRYPDRIRVGARTSRLADDRFEMEYRIFSERLEAIAAEGVGIVVAYDYEKRQKTNLPGPVADRIREMDRPARWK